MVVGATSSQASTTSVVLAAAPTRVAALQTLASDLAVAGPLAGEALGPALRGTVTLAGMSDPANRGEAFASASAALQATSATALLGSMGAPKGGGLAALVGSDVALALAAYAQAQTQQGQTLTEQALATAAQVDVTNAADLQQAVASARTAAQQAALSFLA